MSKITIEITNAEHDLIVRKTAAVDDLYGREATDHYYDVIAAANGLIPKKPIEPKPTAAPAATDTADGSF